MILYWQVTAISITLHCLFVPTATAFLPRPFHRHVSVESALPSVIRHDTADDTMVLPKYPVASLVGYTPIQDHIDALLAIGYQSVTIGDNNNNNNDDISRYQYKYTFVISTGMLKLLQEPEMIVPTFFEAPRWVPIVRGFENILVQNGWSFLDPDEHENISAFLIDAANIEGQYKPKWGDPLAETENLQLGHYSNLGLSLRQMTTKEITTEAETLDEHTLRVLLEGDTDPYNDKTTQNGYCFQGSVRQDDMEQGVFVCAIGHLPLFTTLDLTMSTVRSGWLSFSQPVSDDHIILVQPEKDKPDQRTEVVCARSGCHLGHYFGKGNGYCINAGALTFIPSQRTVFDNIPSIRPVLLSWHQLQSNMNLPSARVLSNVLFSTTVSETIVFGAGCFWHIEFALRRLPGVISTQVGYAGGRTTAPTYDDVCNRDTGHAEVVRVTFDPNVLDPRILVDCMLALHDPTKVRAHGSHAQETGQYRSCVFVASVDMHSVVEVALDACQEQLGKDLSTQVRKMDLSLDSWFWPAEDRHQRHDEKRAGPSAVLSTLSVVDWLQEYGKRSETVWGSSLSFSSGSSLTSM